MPRHLLATFVLDIETYIVSNSPSDITHSGDYDFFCDNNWYSYFNISEVYDLLRKESMI